MVEVDQGIRNNLVSINRQIGALYNGRTQHELSLQEREQLSQLHDQKIVLTIQTLELRQSGEDMIKLALTGRPGEPLHPFSRNTIVISFLDERYGRYKTGGDLARLREQYVGDISLLIGTPDYFLPEPDEGYLVRTITEVNKVSASKKRYADPRYREQFEKLKVMLGERVLSFRIDNPLGKQVEVVYLKAQNQPIFDLIEVNFVRPGRPSTGFHLLSPGSYLFPNRLTKLIAAGGGYDFITQRR